MKLKIRKAEQQDCQDIYDWRNDPESIKNSLNKKKIDLQEHTAWFTAKLNDKDAQLFIILDESQNKIGMVRFDISDNGAKVSINLNPSFRGKGFGYHVLAIGIEQFAHNFNGMTLTAEIKEENIPSIKIFQKAGFVNTQKNEGVLLFERQI